MLLKTAINPEYTMSFQILLMGEMSLKVAISTSSCHFYFANWLKMLKDTDYERVQSVQINQTLFERAF